MSKFKVGEPVRVIMAGRWFDATGVIEEVQDWTFPPKYPFRVRIDGESVIGFTEHELTLADPDVHTVLDQMDAESALPQADLTPHLERLVNSGIWTLPEPDPVSAPSHYRSHPSGIETITITRHESFLRGNVLKYVLRAPYKGSEIEDLKKAAQYLQWEIDRAEAAQ